MPIHSANSYAATRIYRNRSNKCFFETQFLTTQILFHLVCCRLTTAGPVSILNAAPGYQKVCLTLLHSFLSP